MTSEEDNDGLDDALFEMGSFDAQDAAIEAAEIEGEEPQLPDISDAKFEALVAASLEAADIPPSLEERAPRTRPWTRWAIAAGGVVAATALLWQLSVSPEESLTASSIPAAELRLGGTARTLGDAPEVRPYGPGDGFMLELAFETEPPTGLEFALVARNASGAVSTLALVPRREAGAVVFEGEIATLLEPGVWTLDVDFGVLGECGDGESARCRHLETTIEVLGE